MQWLLEGPAIEPLLQRVRAEHGPDVKIVRAERVRVGGFIGFFAKEQFEVTIEVDDEAAGAAAGSATPQSRGVVQGQQAQHALTGTRSDPSLTIGGLDALLAAAEYAEGSSGGASRVSFEAVMDTMARGGGIGSIGDRGVTVLPETPMLRPTGPGWLRSEAIPPTPPSAASSAAGAPAATSPVASAPPVSGVRHPTSWDPDWDPDWEPPWEAAPWEPAPFTNWTPTATGSAEEPVVPEAAASEAEPTEAASPAEAELADVTVVDQPVAEESAAQEPELQESELQEQGEAQELSADVIAMITTGSPAVMEATESAVAPSEDPEPPAAEPVREITRSFAAIPVSLAPTMLALEASARPAPTDVAPTDVAPSLVADSSQYRDISQYLEIADIPLDIPEIAEPAQQPDPAYLALSSLAPALLPPAPLTYQLTLPTRPAPTYPAVPTQRSRALVNDEGAPLSRREARRLRPRLELHEGECLPERLAALGVPLSWLDGLPAGRAEALRHIADAITATPSQARRKQTVAIAPLVVVLADLASALPVGRRLAVGLGLDAAEVVVMHKKQPGMVRDRCLPDRAALLAEVDRARDRSRALVVVLPSPVGAKPAVAGSVTDTLSLLDADEVWAVVDATRRLEDTATWLASLTGTRGVDAVALTNTDVTVAPAAALNLAAPVVLLGELPATPTAWVSLLAARLAAQDLA